MGQNNIPWIQFLVVLIAVMLSCSTAVDNVRWNYKITDGEKEEEIIVNLKNDGTDLYLKLINIADSLLLLSDGKQNVNAGSIQLELLSEEFVSVAKQDLTLTSYYLIVDSINNRHFFWGMNVNREETIYFTNPDGDKTLELVSKTIGKEMKSYLKLLDYIKNKYLKAPPMPSLPEPDTLYIK
jgi:hypothetical protein